MINAYRTQAKRSVRTANKNTIDTSYVLFFLAMEFGNSFGGFSLDSFALGLTLVCVIVLPFWLNSERGKFADWMLVRSVTAFAAVAIGVMFRQSLGVLIPEIYSFLPMTLLLVTAILSVYFQFYSFLKLRIVK